MTGISSEQRCRLFIASCLAAHKFNLSHYCGVHLDHFMKVLSARIHHANVTLFSFVMNKSFLGEELGKYITLCSSSDFNLIIYYTWSSSFLFSVFVTIIYLETQLSLIWPVGAPLCCLSVPLTQFCHSLSMFLFRGGHLQSLLSIYLCFWDLGHTCTCVWYVFQAAGSGT